MEKKRFYRFTRLLLEKVPNSAKQPQILFDIRRFTIKGKLYFLNFYISLHHFYLLFSSLLSFQNHHCGSDIESIVLDNLRLYTSSKVATSTRTFKRKNIFIKQHVFF